MTGFNTLFIITLTRTLAKFYHYYIQLKVIGDEMAANENGFFSENDVKILTLCYDRF